MSNRKKAPKGFLTAKEAMAVVGVPNTSFYNLVRDEVLHKVMFPGRKEAVYSEIEVENYARSVKAFSAPYLSERLDFGLALNEDIPQIHDLVASVSGGKEHAVPEEILKAWIRKNPQSVHILRRSNEVLGYISMFPLQEDVLIQRLDGTLFNRSIPIDAIQRFTPNTKINLYVAEMAVKHAPEYLLNDEPASDKYDPTARRLGYRLIQETLRFLSTLERQKTQVQNLYAVGTSKYGISLCTELGMEVMGLPTGVRETRKPFQLHIENGVQSIIVRRLLARRAA